jgi:N-acetylglucosaminyldiphosphoundecaprenol N-acetyl-beta-D-mannosaminyltransferase
VTEIVLFGSRFDPLTLDEACDAVERMIALRDRCHLVCVKDVAQTMRSRTNPELARFYAEQPDLVLVDGRGLLMAAWLLGSPFPGPVDGLALYEALLRRASERGYRVFLLGARPPVVAAVATRLAARMPGLAVVGSHHGYFGRDGAAVVRTIREARPDLLFIGMSSPQREQFLERWLPELPAGVCVPVGGVFDIGAGVVREAPRWVRASGTEWLFRIAQEPQRLVGRYARTHTLFGALLAAALVRRARGLLAVGRKG